MNLKNSNKNEFKNHFLVKHNTKLFFQNKNHRLRSHSGFIEMWMMSKWNNVKPYKWTWNFIKKIQKRMNRIDYSLCKNEPTNRIDFDVDEHFMFDNRFSALFFNLSLFSFMYFWIHKRKHFSNLSNHTSTHIFDETIQNSASGNSFN